MAFMQTDMNETDSLIKGRIEISKEYHIPLLDIKKLLGVRFIPLDWLRQEIKTLYEYGDY